jgi:hypothetical protein
VSPARSHVRGQLDAVSLVDLTRTAAGLFFSSYDTPVSMWVVVASILMSIYTSVTVCCCTLAVSAATTLSHDNVACGQSSRRQLIGAPSIGIAFGYFVVVLGLTLVLNSRVARSTFRVNEGEGYFRFRHARIKEFAECGESASL